MLLTKALFKVVSNNLSPYPIWVRRFRQPCHNKLVSENVYYHATLLLTAPLTVQEDKGGKRVSVEIAGKPFPLILKRKMQSVLEAHPPGENELDVILWPRTDKEGLLGSGTQLATYLPAGEAKKAQGLHALGELVKLDREDALIQVQIHPNPKQGGLHKPFRLPLVVSMELMDGLPEIGSGLEVWADLEPTTGQVVLKKVRAVPLPPKRVVQPSSDKKAE